MVCIKQKRLGPTFAGSPTQAECRPNAAHLSKRNEIDDKRTDAPRVCARDVVALQDLDVTHMTVIEGVVQLQRTRRPRGGEEARPRLYLEATWVGIQRRLHVLRFYKMQAPRGEDGVVTMTF